MLRPILNACANSLTALMPTTRIAEHKYNWLRNTKCKKDGKEVYQTFDSACEQVKPYSIRLSHQSSNKSYQKESSTYLDGHKLASQIFLVSTAVAPFFDAIPSEEIRNTLMGIGMLGMLGEALLHQRTMPKINIYRLMIVGAEAAGTIGIGTTLGVNFMPVVFITQLAQQTWNLQLVDSEAKAPDCDPFLYKNLICNTA